MTSPHLPPCRIWWRTYRTSASFFLILAVCTQRIVSVNAFIQSFSLDNNGKKQIRNEKEPTLLFANAQQSKRGQLSQQQQPTQPRRFAQARTQQQQSFASDSKLGSMYKQRIKTAGRKGTKRFVDPCKVFIGNMPFDVDDKQLGSFILETMGQTRMVLHSFKVIRDWKTGKSKGYGFVEFTDPIYATVCMEVCNGKKLNGRPIRIDQGKKKDVEDQVSFNKKKKTNKLETEEDRAISSALNEAESDDDDDSGHNDDNEYSPFNDNIDDDDIELDAALFGLVADDDEEDDDGIFLERPSKYDEDDELGEDLNREQRREAARRRKRKRKASKGFG